MSNQNINQEIGIQVTFILEIKLEKNVFQQTMTVLAANMSFFKPMLVWEPTQVCRNLKTKNEGIYGKVFEMKVTCVLTG